MQSDTIDEHVKENNQDKETRVVTKTHVPGEESLYFCISASFLSGILVWTHACVCICDPKSPDSTLVNMKCWN